MGGSTSETDFTIETVLPGSQDSRVPLSKRSEFSPYYEHENNTGPRQNQQINTAGLTLYFPRDKK
jgi:hypothetical protein